MKITGHGANRIVHIHNVIDDEMEDFTLEDGKVKFNALTKYDPGIGQGQFILNFEFEKDEIFRMYETAMRIESQKEIEKLKKDISKLQNTLIKAGVLNVFGNPQ